MGSGFFNIKDQSNFLGGQNVHNLAMLILLGIIVYKVK
jgi:hypothetical protein